MLKSYILIILLALTCHSAFSQRDSSSVKDSLLQQQIEAEMQKPAPAQPRAAVSANPDISVIGDFRAHYTSNMTRKWDAELHEAEFSFQSVIDPYARADFFYSVGHDPVTGEFKGEIEEGYLTTLSL